MASRFPALDLTELLANLRALPAAGRYWVALSGGCDSSVLLHAMATLGPRLGQVSVASVHVDHGLHPDSAAWARHCHAFSAQLGIPCTVLQVDARPSPGQSREAAARAARYDALAHVLEEGDMLLTAHHQEDQAETLLLQLLRGAGPAGLAAMPAHVPLGGGVLARPLLGVPRSALHSYASHYDLIWVEDPSNFDTALDRNYLRHEILPRLRARWPAADGNLHRAASHQAETAALLDVLGRSDLQQVQGVPPGTLRVDRLLAFDDVRQRNVLRSWLRERGLNVPSTRVLSHVCSDILRAGWDREPCVAWEGAQLRRYRNELHAMVPLAPLDPATELMWRVDEPLVLPAGLGEFHAHLTVGRGIRYGPVMAPLRVGFRRGGERCRPSRGARRRDVKTLFQEQGVPPWERNRIPFVYVGNDLAAVVGHWICAEHAAASDEPGLLVEWRKSASL